MIKELQRLERAAKGGAELKQLATRRRGQRGSTTCSPTSSQKKRGTITSAMPLAELGFDSLMFTELAAALEAAGVELPDPAELIGLETVADVEKLVARVGAKSKATSRAAIGCAARKTPTTEDDEIDVPQPARRARPQRAARRHARAVRARARDRSIHGTTNVPPFGGYIVAANHASHLDTGLVKYALGEQGEALVALGAKDYFFEDPVRRMYFENFTNVVPMERHGSLRESLRLAGEVIRDGYILLIFPEGTRIRHRRDGGLQAVARLSRDDSTSAASCRCISHRTHEAMPKGRYLPKRGERVAAYIGPYLSYDDVAKLAARSRAATAIARSRITSRA